MSQEQEDDPAQADRAWSGYHPRAALPAVAVAAVVSLLVWMARWYLADVSELTEHLGALAVIALAWGAWPVLATAYVYRMVTYTYRLTDRAVLIDFGFWHRPVAPLWLREVREVRVLSCRWCRLLGVGCVEVLTPERTVTLLGVRQPEAFAGQILAARNDAQLSERSSPE